MGGARSAQVKENLKQAKVEAKRLAEEAAKAAAEKQAAEEARLKEKLEGENTRRVVVNAGDGDSGDGIVKYTYKEGEGGDDAVPAAGAQVKAHYTGTLLDGTKFDSSRDRDAPFDFQLGQGQVIKCWDQAFATMKKGEQAILECTHEFAYGEAGSPPTIPGKATLRFDVELLGWDGDGGKSEL